MGSIWSAARRNMRVKAWTVLVFLEDYTVHPINQIDILVQRNNLEGVMNDRGWKAFARVYNGPRQVEIYDRVLSEHWDAIEEMKRNGAWFELNSGPAPVKEVDPDWEALDRIWQKFVFKS